MTVAWPGELGPSGGEVEVPSLRRQHHRRQHRRRQRAQQLTVMAWLIVLSLALALLLAFGWSQARRLTGEEAGGRSSGASVLPVARGA